MPKKDVILLPATRQILSGFGENLRLARLRRNISAQLLAERAGISRTTLSLIEKGAPSVAFGNYVQVLVSLGLENELSKIALEDSLGRKLQDAELTVRKRASRKESI